MTTQDTHKDRVHGNEQGKDPQGPTYLLDLEGVEREWQERTITVAQIRDLAGWAAGQQIVMVNLDTNEETVLDEGATVELKPGHGFGRKFNFRRGSR